MNNKQIKNRFTGIQIMRKPYHLLIISLLFILTGCDFDEKSRIPQPDLAIPSNVTVLNSINNVTISWDATANASEYALYRCPANISTLKCDVTSVSACGASILTTSALSAVDDNLIPLVDGFCYGVQACNGNSCSEISVQELGYLLPVNILTLDVSGATTVVETQNVSLHAITRKTEGTVSYAWLQTGGPTVTLSSTTTADIDFTSPNVSTPETLTFTVTATDDNEPVTKTVSVIVNDDAIFVDAGNSSFVPAGQTVSLHGVGNGAGGSSVYAWTQVAGSGPSVTLINANTSNPEFDVPVVTAPTDFIFELTFSDGISSAKDRVTVSVSGPVATPLPHAPLIPVGAFANQPLLVTVPQWLAVAELTNHDLSSFVIGGDGNYSYSWALAGITPVATLTNATSQIANIAVPDVTVTTIYEATLSVTDGSGNSDSSIVQIEVANGPALTTLAVIAPPLVVSGGPIEAVLSASAIGGTGPYTFSWAQATGPSVTLSDATTNAARFNVPPVTGDTELTFNITVTDSLAATATRVVKVLIRDVFAHTPTQVLRLQPLPDTQVLGGKTVTLAVAATGGDQNYTWSWTQTAGPTAGNSGANTNTVAITTPTVTTQQTLSFQVTVTDGLAATVNETINVIALPTASTLPLSFVSVPDMHIDEGLVDATITGLAQGGTGNYTYNWQYDQSIQFDPTIIIALSDSDKSVTRFNMPGVNAKTVLRFDLTINDGVSTITEKVFVVVNDLSSTLSLGHLLDQRVHSGDTVHLNGATASGGVSPYTYFWTKTAGPAFTLTGPTTVNPSFVAPSVPTSTPVTFSYVITDAVGNTVSVSETVTVDPVIPPLSGSLDGPDEVAGGQSASFNAAVAGGTPPLTFTYSTIGVPFILPATANPTVTLPTVTADTTATITLVVHDSATPQNSITLTHIIKVTAPPAATGGRPPGLGNVCGDPFATPPVACTLMELVLVKSTEMKCEGDTPYAMNDIFATKTSSGFPDVLQFRRCASESQCDTQYFQATSDKPLCLEFDANVNVDIACHLCCWTPPGGALDDDGNNIGACNSLDVPPKNTWWKPYVP